MVALANIDLNNNISDNDSSPTPNSIGKSTFKEDLGLISIKLRLKWNYHFNHFKPTSKFNPPRSNTAI